MTQHFDLRCGHVMTLLGQMPDESVNCVVTSPPYWGLRDYGTDPQIWGGESVCAHEWGERHTVRDIREDTITGKTRTTERFYGEESRRFNGNHQKITDGQFCQICGAWYGSFGLEPNPNLYVEHLVEIFQEVRRVLAANGTLWLNIGDSYAGSWGNQGRKDERGIQRPINCSMIQPVHDDRHPSKQSNTGKIPEGSGLKPKDLVGVPWMAAFALRSDGWYLRSEIIWSKRNCMPESVRDRPTRAHEQIFLIAKSERYYYDADAIREPHSEVSIARARRNRFGGKYIGSDPAEHGAMKAGNGYGPDGNPDLVCHPEGRNKRSVWTVATCPTPEGHFATFPIDLIEPCILAGCPPDGVVLDPFNGAGTTGLAALKNGRKYIGLELNPEYIEISRQRARKYYPLLVDSEGDAA